MYDIFVINRTGSQTINEVRNRYPNAREAVSIADARKKALTKMYWVIDDTLMVLDSFDMTFQPEPWDQEYVHIFKNNNSSTGVVLIPKRLKITEQEENGEFTDKKELDIVASASRPYDIVFISNGEEKASEHWIHLKRCTQSLPNRVLHVTGVNGRANAYKEAARITETKCFFAVFAKIEVDDEFDWSWTGSTFADRHYIFMAENPVNGLVYGHQAVIAYNKKLVLENPGNEIDFTLAQPHEVVNILSGKAHYNSSPLAAWRTAFREALKLSLYAHRGDQEAAERLKAWLIDSAAPFSRWSVLGACDAVQYYQDVQGDKEKLQLSYEWSWLNDFFSNKYSDGINGI